VLANHADRMIANLRRKSVDVLLILWAPSYKVGASGNAGTPQMHTRNSTSGGGEASKAFNIDDAQPLVMLDNPALALKLAERLVDVRP
jgi:hypothetical protein